MLWCTHLEECYEAEPLLMFSRHFLSLLVKIYPILTFFLWNRQSDYFETCLDVCSLRKITEQDKLEDSNINKADVLPAQTAFILSCNSISCLWSRFYLTRLFFCGCNLCRHFPLASFSHPKHLQEDTAKLGSLKSWRCVECGRCAWPDWLKIQPQRCVA